MSWMRRSSEEDTSKRRKGKEKEKEKETVTRKEEVKGGSNRVSEKEAGLMIEQVKKKN